MSNGVNLRESALDLRRQLTEAQAELAALKAQEPVAYISGCYRDVIDGKSDRTPLGAELAFVNMGWIGQIPLYAAPVSDAKAQGEYGDAYQGAREDLSVWKRRALETEEKVRQQEETANQWRELALQFDRHRMTAMAHIRAAASGDKSAIEALGVFAALPPIPGHEITAEFDQQAQRIGELEGLLLASAELIKHGVFEDGICCCGASVDSHGFGDGHSPVDALAYHAGQVCERIDAALSAGKERQDEHS